MKVTLNIENDAELRAHIKDCIKGQVISIVRDELLTIIKETLIAKFKQSSQFHFEVMVEESLNKGVKEILEKNHGVSRWNHDFLQPLIADAVGKTISERDFAKIVNDIAAKKIADLVK